MEEYREHVFFQMVAHFIMFTCRVNKKIDLLKASAFIERILKSECFFYRKLPILHHTCATCYHLIQIPWQGGSCRHRTHKALQLGFSSLRSMEFFTNFRFVTLIGHFWEGALTLTRSNHSVKQTVHFLPSFLLSFPRLKKIMFINLFV